MENQILKAINHIKYVSKKKHCPVKIFNYLQNNGASNYDYDSVVNKIQELMENGIINYNYKIIDPVTEVLNLSPDDEIEICSEISVSNDLDSQPSQISSSNKTPIVNVATTPTLNTVKTPKHHSDDIETLIKSLEDKLLSKIAALQSHFFNDIFDLRKDITLLKENNEKAKPADLNNKKDEVMSHKEKIKFLESENSFLKNDINIKQRVIDSILEHNSNLLNYQCCRGSEKANNEIYQKSSETREKKLKTSPDKNRNRDSNINNTNVTARKHNDKPSQSEDKDEVRGNKTPKKDVVIIGDSMIKYVNGRETTEDFIDYVRPTARKNPKMMVIHSGTNDLTYKVNTMQKIRKVINAIKENDLNNEIEIVLSSVIHQDDQDLEDEINKLNEKLENLCKGKGMRFIDNSKKVLL